VLGVDGGQSGIRVAHSARGGVVEVGGVSRQEGDVASRVAEAVAAAWRQAGSPPVGRVVMGLTTAPDDVASSDRLCRHVAAATGAEEVWLADDAVTSHAGALSACPGVSVICGTGVASLALPAHGGPLIVGGHGYLIGDEGGAFWIGRRGLGAALRALDGRGPVTTLTSLAARRFGTLADLHVRIYDDERPIDTIARFAPDVLHAAAAGDEPASTIVDDAARELALVAEAGAAVVASDGAPSAPSDPVAVALGGRLLAPGTELRRRLNERLGGSPCALAVRDADSGAVDGALLLGRQLDPGRYRPLVHVWLGPARA
jgi:N-acetylglucosamine kinase-like BadF-type ATPase